MSIVKFIQGIGDRLGVLESVTVSETTRVTRIQTRSVSLRELVSEIKSGEVRALADSPAELSVPFEKIFETAGISSDPGEWTIDKLKQLISSKSLENKPREEIQRSVLDQLKSENVPVEKIVKDAMARDQALDSFESSVGDKMRARMESGKRQLQELELRIQDLQKESAALEKALKSDEEKWKEWRRLKREQERDLASTVGYIIDHPVITLSDTDG
jgi:hypothetical protein